MLTRCACTFRRTQSGPANFQLQLRQLRIHGIKIKRHQYTTDELPTDSSESTTGSQPWQHTLDAPVHHWRAKNIVLGDLQATIEAHKQANLVRKIKLEPKGRKTSNDGKLYNVDGIGVGDGHATDKNKFHGVHRLELDTLSQWMGNNHVKPDDNVKLFKEGPLKRPSPSTEELEQRESTSEHEWTEQQPIDQSSRRTATYIVDNPQNVVGEWVRHSGQVGGDPQRPWLKLTDTDSGDAIQRLTAEIQAFENYMTLTKIEERAAEATTLLINHVARACGVQNQLSFHGSRCTGLANPYSDLDVHFAIPKYEKQPGTRGPSPSRPKAKRAGLDLLWKIYRKLARFPVRVHDLEFIRARIPLVVGFDNIAKIKFQCMALTPVRSSLDFTAYYLSEYPNLRPLFFLLRQTLEMRSLNVVKEGGLGSYPLFIMILTALNHDVGYIPKDDLASQLLQVLKFWSEADLRKNGYSADPPRAFPKVKRSKMTSRDDNNSFDDIYIRGIDMMQKHYPEQPFLLCLQDPGDPVNDLGRKTWRIREIQDLFRRAHRKIIAMMDQYEEIASADQRRNWKKGILDCLVKGAYGQFESQRHLVEENFQTSKPWQPPPRITSSVVMTDSAQPLRILKYY